MTAGEVALNLADVRGRIAEAALAAGRDPAGVRLLPVTKTVSEERIREVVAAGCTELGENKVQEARLKAEHLADLDVRWSLVGHLQTNKAKHVAAFAHEIQTLDSIRLAEELDRRLQALGRGIDVLVQVNTSGEEAKFGLPLDEVAGFLAQLPKYAALRVRGLMTIAPLSPDREQARTCFASLRILRDRLRQAAPEGISLDELSMGMSGDYEIAIDEGATVVRIGQAIFGPRPPAA